jgi:PA domain-containing protein/carboxypeptidase family protein/uncharacterized protein DUF4214
MRMFRPISLVVFSLILVLAASSSAFGAATIVILNADGAGEGFNDPTVVAPVGGNPGTTLGAQRLNAFTEAANIWGATLTSSITITVRAQFNPLTCTATSAVLGSAGATFIERDFAGAPFAATWYHEALAEKLFGAVLEPTHEINATFNTNLGQTGCLDGIFFYLGLDNNHGANVDLVTVLLHEFGHGLGFSTFTSGTTGAQNSGFPAIYDRFLIDLSTGKSWLQMTNAERAASAINARKLAWTGPKVETDVPSVLAAGYPLLRVNSPPAIAGDYEVGTASFGPALTAGGVTGNVVQALDPSDGAGVLTTDGCTALTNAAAVAGNIAIIDRGTCTFPIKVKNAQDAGAIAVIIADNVAGSPPAGLGGTDATIVIPSVRVTQADGNTIKAQLGTGVNVSLLLDTTRRAGADRFGKALLFSPNPFQSGSSVSHWDTIAFPNQLMEPAINGDLTHNVTAPSDLTFAEMSDIGWVASALPSSISKTSGDNQNTSLNQSFLVPFSVTVSPAVSGITVTWTVNPNGAGAGATFPSTSSRFAISTTNVLGVASAPALTANGQPGFYSMNATVPGAGTTTFALQNDAVPAAGISCLTDTTQADFQAGVPNNTDVNTSPDNVILLNAANLDQQNTTLGTSGVAINITTWGGQTFTPAVTGQLAMADINLFCSGCTGTTPSLTLSVRATSGGLPTGADLATATITGFNSGVAVFYTGIFASPPTLTAGTMYALAIRPTANPSAGTYAITRSGTATLGADVYAGGTRVAGATSGTVWSIPLTPATTGISTDAGFRTFMQTGFAASGDFVSGLKDSNPLFGNTFWTTMTWNATVPAGTTLQFQVAGSNSFGGPFNFVGPDGTPATFYTTSPASISQFFLSRYLKYKAFFTTTDNTVTATLNDVTVCFNNPPTAAPATISGQITTADGSPLAGVTMNLSGARSARTITDSNGNYRFSNVDTDNFYVVTPSLVNYRFGPAERSFSLVGNKTDAVFTATRDAVITGNAIDTSEFFVRQHYLDFLGREPDEGGFNFWSDQISSCGADAGCIERRTINVSAAYFLSIEFQQTGGLVAGLYRTSYDRRPLFAEFMPDAAMVARDVVVGPSDWARQLEINKQAFVNAWVQRPAFQSVYGDLPNAAYVDTLISHTGVSFSQSEREALVNALTSGTSTRAKVLRQIAENERFVNAKRNEVFVMMEYFGYLRRDPDEEGFRFWLNKLNRFNGNFEQAEMVKAFINSGEYRERFRQQ